jgi:hypothetical protein
MSARKFDLFKPKSYGNVVIKQTSEHDGLYVHVLLHGNEIMIINTTQQWFRMSHCGWTTSTTKTAINTALKQFRPDVAVFQQKGEWFVSFANGEEISVFTPNACYGYGKAGAK